MIAFERGAAVVRLPAGIYTRESLESAAGSLSDRLKVALRKAAGGGHRVSIRSRSARRTSEQALLELAGEFLNEALNHRYRRLVVRFNGPLARPVLERVFRKGFFNVPDDPLERIEPQVAEDRRNDTVALLREARRMGAKR